MATCAASRELELTIPADDATGLYVFQAAYACGFSPHGVWTRSTEVAVTDSDFPFELIQCALIDIVELIRWVLYILSVPRLSWSVFRFIF